MNNNIIVIILAGGQGSRFGGKKQFIEFNNKPLWKHVYDKASKTLPIDNICIVGIQTAGGKTRSHSVINGLAFFENKIPRPNRVIILEAARPLVTLAQIEIMIQCEEPSCSFVQPLVNTIIKKDCSYINRSDYYELLTPQAFNYEMLKNAYASKDSWEIVEETQVMYEYYGIKPKLIETGRNLFKVTYPYDIAIIEQIDKLQKEGLL
jgi:2-C-methyl-D-erythritol 4-phosphate cytidylyltransferase